MQIVLEFVKITSERALRNIIAGERQEEVYPGPRVRTERLEREIAKLQPLMSQNVSSLES